MSDGKNESPPISPGPSGSSERVLLEFGSFREFIDDYSSHISNEGIFVLGEAREVGSEVAFEVRLSDDFRLIHGTGSVEWTVPEGAEGQEAGSALRFTSLDEPSQRLVTRLVDNHRTAGGSPFDISRSPVTGQEAAEPEPPPGLPLVGEIGRETIAIPMSLTGLDLDRAAQTGGEVESEAPAEPEELATVEEAVGEAPDFGVEPDVPTATLMELDPVPPPSASEAVDDLAAVFEPADPAPEPDESGLETSPWTSPVAPPGDDPLEHVDPDETSVFDLVEDAIGGRSVAEPEVASGVLDDEPFGGLGEPGAAVDSPHAGLAKAVAELAGPPSPAQPVEMPDEEDLTAGYYRTGKAPRRASTFLWIALCGLAIVLGVTAWRYKDTLMELARSTFAGAAASDAPAAVATARPGSEEGDEVAGTASGESEAAGGLGDADGGDQRSEPLADGEGAGDPTVAVEPSASEPATVLAAGPTRVENISFRRSGGNTEVLIVTDRPLTEDGYEVIRVSEPPARQVIKVYGPRAPYGREAIAVGTEQVHRLRTGFHRSDGRGEVHIVADLTGPGVNVVGVDLRGATLAITFGSS